MGHGVGNVRGANGNGNGVGNAYGLQKKEAAAEAQTVDEQVAAEAQREAEAEAAREAERQAEAERAREADVERERQADFEAARIEQDRRIEELIQQGLVHKLPDCMKSRLTRAERFKGGPDPFPASQVPSVPRVLTPEEKRQALTDPVNTPIDTKRAFRQTLDSTPFLAQRLNEALKS